MKIEKIFNKVMEKGKNVTQIVDDFKDTKISYRKDFWDKFILKIIEGDKKFNGIEYGYKQEHGFSFKENEFIYHKIYIENDFEITFENLNGEVFSLETENFKLNYFKKEICLINKNTGSKITNNYNTFLKDAENKLKVKLILSDGEIINYFFDNLVIKGFGNEILEDVWNKLTDPFVSKFEYDNFKSKKYLENVKFDEKLIEEKEIKKL